MAKFFAGQPVRVVCQGSREYGKETRVLNPYACYPDGDPGIEVAIQCRLPGWPFCIFEADELEPITPPHIPGSWEVIEQLLPNIREGVAA